MRARSERRSDPCAGPDDSVARSRRRHGCLLLPILLAGLLLASAWAAREPLLTGFARFLDVSEEPVAVDYVLVLGGGPETRPFLAAALYRTGLAAGVLLTRPTPTADVEDGISPPAEEVARRALLQQGVPQEVITTLPGRCDSTREEARRLRRFLEEHPGRTIAVATSSYHTRRARLIFGREFGGDAATRVKLFVGIPRNGFWEGNWWQSRDGFATYARESLKLLYCLIP